MLTYWIAMDTETTGFDPETNSLVEIAAVGEDGYFAHSLIKPTTPIGFGAMATHHITPQMVENEYELDQVLEGMNLSPEDLNSETDIDLQLILVFHNAEFDRSFLPKHLQELPFVCTWRCAVAMFPDAESHSNGALWHELGLNHVMPPEAGTMPHRALFDAIMTADIMRFMLEHISKNNPNISSPIDHLIWLTKQPILLKTCKFGKHRGSEWKDVPVDYMQWCLRQDMDEDVKYTCRFWIEEFKRG